MQQHLMQMQPMMGSYYPNNVTTDHIQQYLDENKSLILKIVEGQNSGKLSECAENQSRLQRNLMFLAAIADSQPQPPAIPAQYSTSGLMQQQGSSQYVQAQQMTQQQQQQLIAARSSLLYAQQQQPLSMLQQQALHTQLGMSSGGGRSAGLDGMMQGEGYGDLHGVGRGKQLDIGSSGGERGETLNYLKAANDAN